MENNHNTVRPNSSVTIRGPKPSLSKAQIALAATSIADKEGLSAVTMKRIAHEVGLTTMALYRYFPGKAEIVAEMIDSVADSDCTFGKPSSPWSIRVKQWAHQCLAIYLKHPWFLEATTARQIPMGPNELLWMEAALSFLAESGLKAMKRQEAFFAIVGHVRGHATFQWSKEFPQAKGDLKREFHQALNLDPKRYPALFELIRSGTLNKGSLGSFDFGLDCIVNGIRAGVSDR
ncbi:MAG: TetR/AcrR family transcriptional regulator [Acidobacteria bacterium]|nr:TetR/AcrR family transcriptional regulator [Acidobacteriota bacterium]